MTHDITRDEKVGFSWSNVRRRSWEIFTCLFLWLVSLTMFGLFAWGSIASTAIISDTVALSESANCGFWMLDSTAQPKVNGSYGYLYLQEVESAEYASRCYGTAPGTDGCNFFTTQDIPYSEEDDILDDLHPFSDDLCLDGRFSALTMRTGLVSSKDLGINVPIGYTFNRSTTCVPIKRDGYVIDTGASYEYQYGIYQGSGNATFSTPKIQPKIFSGYDVA